MATQVQRRRGTASEHNTFTGAAGEVTVNTTNDSLHVHDGATTGGFEAMRADANNAQNDVITNAMLSLNANDGEIKKAINSDNAPPIYACRAWVNFDGTGTVSIRESGNVSSISDNGNGDHTVNLLSSMPDNNYAVIANCEQSVDGFTPGTSFMDIAQAHRFTTTSFRIAENLNFVKDGVADAAVVQAILVR